MARENPFADLAAEERLQIASLRIVRAEELLHQVLYLNEQLTAFLAVDLSAAPQRAHTTLVVTMLNFEVLQLCRLWDAPDLSSYGVPAIVALIDSDEVLGLVRAHLISQGESEGAADEVVKGVGAAVAATAAIEKSSELARLQNYRNKHIAHPILRSRAERKGPIHDPAAQEREFLVLESMSILTMLSRARGAEVAGDFASIRDAAQRIEREFMSGIRFVTPG